MEILGIWIVIALVAGAIIWRAHCEKGKVISDPGSIYHILKGRRK